jgi:membrane associated rhomboid family serine protease
MRIWTTGIRTGAFTIIQLVIGFFIMIAVGAIFGAIGGALGVAIFGRRQPPVVPPESA